MLKCPNCSHKFYEEKILTFSDYRDWNAYVIKHMVGAHRIPMGDRTSIQSNQKTGRVLAEWNGVDYGYVSESRQNGLKRIAYKAGDRLCTSY